MPQKNRQPQEMILEIIDQAFDRRSWHGTNLRGSIKGMDVNTAHWRPSAGRKNIWEQVLHAAYWKYTVCRRLTGEAKGSFPLKGSNWIARGDEFAGDSRAWQSDVKLLVDIHRELRHQISQLPPEQWDDIPAGRKTSNFFLISGIAAHDLYHAGQIQLLKRLYADAGAKPRGKRRSATSKSGP